MANNDSDSRSKIISLDAAKPVLEPLIPVLKECLLAEWEWIQNILDQDPERRVKLDDTSTLAAMLSNAFRYTARQRLSSECGIKWESTGRMQHGMVGDAIRLRFKKLTNDKTSMNVQTATQSAYYNDPQPPLPKAQLVTSVTYGYTSDRLARELTGAYFVCPDGFAKNHWVWPIFDTGDGGQLNMWDGPFDPDGGNVEPDLAVEINVGKKVKKA
jgi:hypothetical protein